ncbi:MAG: hypothetical protein SGI90_00830 [Candidatus Eisenbacteria bacterium]|nr:hypothetical protein [Candidatus Eisenbacteria bacterium]
MTAYVRAAVAAEIGALRGSSSGRACAVFRAAASIGGFVGAGQIEQSEAEGLLLDAATGTGLPEREALGHIRRGIRCGERTPRAIPNGRFRDQTYVPKVDLSALIDQAIKRPPSGEVEAIWSSSLPVGSDPEVARWFRRRFGDEADLIIERTELWDLARAPRSGHSLPRWACSRGGSWMETGHRVIFRLWDDGGQAVSLRARCTDPATTPKSLAPAGFSVKGLVLADPVGAQLLSGIVPDWWDPREAVVSEGEPDWLTWAARQREAEAQGPACFGVEAGAWSQEIADRIPDGCRVVIRTHHDEPGERYAHQIVATLHGRCQVFRSRPSEEVVR